jgi:hypothetical protein
MTQHEQGLTSGNVERAVSVSKWHIAEPDHIQSDFPFQGIGSL